MAEVLKQLAILLAQAGVDAVRKALKPKPAAGRTFKDVEHIRAQIRKATEHGGK